MHVGSGEWDFPNHVQGVYGMVHGSHVSSCLGYTVNVNTPNCNLSRYYKQ